MVKKSSFVQRVKLKGDGGNSSSGFFFVYIWKTHWVVGTSCNVISWSLSLFALPHSHSHVSPSTFPCVPIPIPHVFPSTVPCVLIPIPTCSHSHLMLLGVLLLFPDEKSDFRAHFVDSYLQQQQIVVCDGPTEESTAKFWQMVWDEGCTYVVMLTPVDGEVS